MTNIELLRILRTKINLDKSKWNNPKTTNCYAYALGLDIPQYKIMEYAYCPGTISNCPIELCNREYFSYYQLINSVYSDLEALGISFREVSPVETIDSDEWKIALYTTPSFDGGTDALDDYHFLRLCKDGIWHHKVGWGHSPTIYDDNKQVIENLNSCYFEDRYFNTCLSLKLKK